MCDSVYGSVCACVRASVHARARVAENVSVVSTTVFNQVT